MPCPGPEGLVKLMAQSRPQKSASSETIQGWTSRWRCWGCSQSVRTNARLGSTMPPNLLKFAKWGAFEVLGGQVAVKPGQHNIVEEVSQFRDVCICLPLPCPLHGGCCHLPLRPIHPFRAGSFCIEDVLPLAPSHSFGSRKQLSHPLWRDELLNVDISVGPGVLHLRIRRPISWRVPSQRKVADTNKRRPRIFSQQYCGSTPGFVLQHVRWQNPAHSINLINALIHSPCPPSQCSKRFASNFWPHMS